MIGGSGRTDDCREDNRLGNVCTVNRFSGVPGLLDSSPKTSGPGRTSDSCFEGICTAGGLSGVLGRLESSLIVSFSIIASADSLRWSSVTGDCSDDLGRLGCCCARLLKKMIAPTRIAMIDRGTTTPIAALDPVLNPPVAPPARAVGTPVAGVITPFAPVIAGREVARMVLVVGSGGGVSRLGMSDGCHRTWIIGQMLVMVLAMDTQKKTHPGLHVYEL